MNNTWDEKNYTEQRNNSLNSSENAQSGSMRNTEIGSIKSVWNATGSLNQMYKLCYNGETGEYLGDNKSHVVYLWTETRDGMEYPCYVGQTVGEIEKRITEHFTHPSEYLFQRKLRKRPKIYKCYIIEECSGMDLLNESETKYILLFNTFHDTNRHGYNLTLGGNNGKKSEVMKKKVSSKLIGRKFSEETLEKMSMAHIGKSPSNKGKSPSEETRRLWSAQRKGRVHSDKTKAKMSAARSGSNHHFYGKVHTQDSKIKISKNKPVGLSGVRGVRIINKNGNITYIAQQRYNNTMKYLGSFRNIEDAKRVVEEFRKNNNLYGN